MTAIRRKDGITRRGFLENSVGALATAGVLAGVDPAARGLADNLESAPASRKIAFEEHFAVPETLSASFAAQGPPEFQKQIEEIGSLRIAEMDRGGVELCILSLTAPGIQGIADTAQAIAVARRANDHLAESVAKYPKRLKGFAALPMQDPQAATEELTRCVKNLGFCGVLANGFSETSATGSSLFYDLPQYRPFWERV